MRNIEKSPTGIELDAIEGTITPVTPSPPPPAAPTVEAAYEKPTEIRIEAGTEKKSGKGRRVGIIITVSVAILAAISFFLWNLRGTRSPSTTDQRPVDRSNLTASIGPIITNAGETGNIISITLEINCKNSESKEKVAQMTSLIKNTVVLAMSSQRAVKMADLKDYPLLEAYLVNEIKDILQGTSIEQVRVFFLDSMTQ
jgi:flagellar basal body-associated protein FliL